MKKSGLTFALFALTALTALAAESPFDGTWKLDTQKSHLTGDTFTYSTTASGMMHFSDGAVEWDFATDGKPYPTLPNSDVVWTKVDDHTWDTEYKTGDKVVGKSHRTLSADGKTLTVSYVQYRPDGQADNGTTTYSRVSGGPGLIGTWKDIKAKVPDDTISIAMPSPGKLVFKDVGYQSVIEGPIDGSPLPIKGPTVPPGFTAAYKASGADRLDYTVKLNDKTVSTGFMTVSGSTLTDTSWTPGKENEKTISVFNRQ